MTDEPRPLPPATLYDERSATERPTLRSTTVVVALRVGLVALGAGAVGAAVVLGRGGDAAQVRRYVCPMHGEVTASHPGDCPICGMALEAVDGANHVPISEEPAESGAAHAGATQTGVAEGGTGAQDIALEALRASSEAATLLRFSVAQARRNVNPGEVFAPAIVEPSGAITARLYRDELATLAPDERAEFVPSATPDAPLAVQRGPDEPAVHATLADVVFRPAPGATSPPAGQVGWVKLSYRVRDMLVVRAASVIHSADGPYVLVFSSQKGTLARRAIEVGKEFMGQTAVVGGLRDKEFVIMANAFSFDAERRVQAAP